MHASPKRTGRSSRKAAALLLALSVFLASAALAQTAPSSPEISAYRGLHAAAARGDAAEVRRLAKGGTNLNARDGHGRTPPHGRGLRRAPRGGARADCGWRRSQRPRQREIRCAHHRRGGQHRPHHEPLRRHRPHRGGPPRPCGSGARPHRGQGAARSREQPRLDGPHRGHRSRGRRSAPRGHSEGAGRGGGEREPGRWAGPPVPSPSRGEGATGR